MTRIIQEIARAALHTLSTHPLLRSLIIVMGVQWLIIAEIAWFLFLFFFLRGTKCFLLGMHTFGAAPCSLH